MTVTHAGRPHRGHYDHWVPPETSVAYFDALSAPSKLLLWFDESDHKPFVDEPAAFNRAVVDMVRALVAPQVRRPAQSGPFRSPRWVP